MQPGGETPHAQLILVVQERAAPRFAVHPDAAGREQIDDPDPLRGEHQAAMELRDARMGQARVAGGRSSHQRQRAAHPPRLARLPRDGEFQDGAGERVLLGVLRRKRAQVLPAGLFVRVIPFDPEFHGADPDRVRGPDPERRPDLAVDEHPRPAAQVDAEHPPGDRLQVAMAAADLAVNYGQIGLEVAPHDQKRLREGAARRPGTPRLAHVQDERPARATCFPKQVPGVLAQGPILWTDARIDSSTRPTTYKNRSDGRDAYSSFLIYLTSHFDPTARCRRVVLI